MPPRSLLTSAHAIAMASASLMSPGIQLTTLALTLRLATAATMVEDFETPGGPGRVSLSGSQLEQVSEFATSGANSLRFRVPAWREGQPKWPAFEWKSAVRDWKLYDRLVVDLVNPGPGHPLFTLFISDGKLPFRKGLKYRFDLPERGYRRFVIPLSTFPPEVNRAKISILHLFTEKPAADLTLHLDQFMLLKPGEAAPAVPAAFVRQLANLHSRKLAAAREAVIAARPPTTNPEILSQLDALDRQIEEIATALAADNSDLALTAGFGEELAAIPEKAARWVDIGGFQRRCAEAGLPTTGLLIGMASSMEKILPRAAFPAIRPATRIDLTLARAESESAQVLVLPIGSVARKVQVTAEDLRSTDGTVFPKDSIQCDVTGYVRTRSRPAYGSPHIGWWPDPILDFLGPVEVAAGDLQSFWIQVRAPRDQQPGVYQGKLTVVADGHPPRIIPFSVKVRSFALPRRSLLPLAITFAPWSNTTPETAADLAAWRKLPDSPLNLWRKHKLRWADFLADHYISWDNLYRKGPPDFEVIRHLRDQGRLGKFNLGLFDSVSQGPEPAKAALAQLRSTYDEAKALGVLDHAYLYGFDECKPDRFEVLEKTAQTLRREFPEVPIMTTTYDDSFGQKSVVKSIDTWCPLTPKYDPALAAAARANGKKVWWYVCCGPLHPHANLFLEYPAIEARLLMGSMTARYRPDGFLYYQTSLWNSRHPITNGPFTDWEPRSWTTFHGDGTLVCPGPDGVPLSTIRLENFRDGVEDYAYSRILEEIVRRRVAANGASETSASQWLVAAKSALEVPATLVRSMTDYSRDPAALYAWRELLGNLIDQSGESEIELPDDLKQ